MGEGEAAALLAGRAIIASWAWHLGRPSPVQTAPPPLPPPPWLHRRCRVPSSWRLMHPETVLLAGPPEEGARETRRTSYSRAGLHATTRRRRLDREQRRDIDDKRPEKGAAWAVFAARCTFYHASQDGGGNLVRQGCPPRPRGRWSAGQRQPPRRLVSTASVQVSPASEPLSRTWLYAFAVPRRAGGCRDCQPGRRRRRQETMASRNATIGRRRHLGGTPC